MNTQTHAVVTTVDPPPAAPGASREAEAVQWFSFGEQDCVGYESLHPLTWVPASTAGSDPAD